MKKLVITAFHATLLLTGTIVGAQENYPQKTVRLIVPFAPGGASDFTARIISQSLSEELKQSVIIENKGGAAGNIGMEAAAKAAPDGYTLFFGNVGATAINPSIFAGILKIKPEQDFIAVTKVADVPDVLVVNPTVPVSTLSEFISYATKRKGELNFGTPGSGSQNRLEMEYLMKEAKISMIHVPYKGGAGPAMTDLIGGQTQVMFTTMPSAIGFIKSGRVRALGVTSESRLADLPSVPTLVEQGYPTMVSSSWQGIFVPRGTPAPIVNKLFSALTKVMAQKSLKEKLAIGGVIASTSASPQEFAAFLTSETVRWGKVVREGNITAD
ncbi:MAG: tripartite tricarboxylate transporter substrate binding protein [Pseudomonadota bacterium]